LNPAYQLFLPLIQKIPIYADIDTAFQLHYTGWHVETLSLLFTRLAAYKSYFWGTPWFYTVLLLIYFSTAAAFIELSFSRKYK
jgi:hypothetical protein